MRRNVNLPAERWLLLCGKTLPAVRKECSGDAQSRNFLCAKAVADMRKGGNVGAEAFSGTFLHRDERCGEVCRMSAESLIRFPYFLKGWGDKGVCPGEVSE